MAVIVVPLLVVTWFFTQNPAEEVESVDPAPHVERAREQSPYPVLAPQGLPDGWVPLRVRWARDGEAWITGEPAVGNSWQLGYLNPDGVYIAVQQRDRSPQQFVDQLSRDGVRESEVSSLAGREWERWTSLDDRTRSLVWRDGQMVAVVTGDTSYEVLDTFAASLSDG